MIRAALFDFDGTLADSFAAITASTNHVRESFRTCQSTVERPKFVGTWDWGLAHLLRALVPNASVEEAIARYRTHHQTIMFTLTRPMPEVAKTIPELARRGLRLGVCSNKLRRVHRGNWSSR